MPRFQRGRRSLRDTLLASQKASDLYADMADKPRMDYAIPSPPKKRTRSASGKPLEKHILKAVLQALRAHPKVSFAWRMQSGVFQDGDRFVRVGTKGLPDIVGMLRGGRLFAIECKSASGSVTSEQSAWLVAVRDNGGIAGVARSVEDALALIG